MLCYAIHGWSLVYGCVMTSVAASQDVGALEGRDVGVGMRGSCVVLCLWHCLLAWVVRRVCATNGCVGWERFTFREIGW